MTTNYDTAMARQARKQSGTGIYHKKMIKENRPH